MAKAKQIQYPTQEWLDKWVDTYLDKHPTEKVDDFKALEERAEAEWWDKQIDLGNPTPHDLTPEQEKVSKEARITTGDKKKKTTAYKFEKKARPKDAEKVEIVRKFFEFAENFTENCEITNETKEISFIFNGNSYSLSLIKHRAPKN